ncbi:MAG TPA: SDR family NAD(P)-dependent oxidoreductase [Stellaceae bacterium]|nr:SDR family NAD(P)-dependent oxidoreductase [Stellaceae bacterium]
MNALPETAPPADRKPRSFLFLQGPLCDFFDRLGRELIARGHRVHRVNLNLGDQLFWRLPAVHFRGRFDQWRAFIAREMERHEVTDLILLGDRRPYHLVAAEEARARGIAVICTDLGYVRPDWVTFEQDGMSTFSRLPRDPRVIAELAASLPEPDLEPRFHTPFPLMAALDVAYNLAEVVGRPLYPHYRRHALFHPLAEYAGWSVALARRKLLRRVTEAAKDRLGAEAGSYFLFPLQLATDYQIRAHSPYPDIREAVREVVASFAASGTQRRLVVVIHPLDNGLVRWRPLIVGEARRHGVADRVEVLDGGTPLRLMGNAVGIVTVNSTVGITALRLGVPLKVLGNAIFDMPGLTAQQPLEAFWHDPQPPDPKLVEDFLRVVIAATQVRGGYYERASQQHAIAEMAERLERGLYPLSPLSAAELARRAARPPGRTIVVTGASSGVGLALARAYAAPGVRLCLIGHSAEGLAAAAEDCRQRGAQVDAAQVESGDGAGLIARLKEFDRHAPIDLLFANAEGAGDHNEGEAEPAWLRRRIVEADLLGVMTIVETIAERMQRRRRGRIVIVDSFAVFSLPTDIPAYYACRGGIIAYGRSLRRRLRADKVAVSIVAPGALATRILAGPYKPQGVALDPERIAHRIRRGVERCKKEVGFPSPLAVGRHAAALIPPVLGGWAKTVFVAPADPIDEDEEPSALSGESSRGD